MSFSKDGIFIGDNRCRSLIRRIYTEGCEDINPRPKYADGTPAHSFSINHVMESYDLSKGELPLISLRPIAIKSAIAEILWIYQKESSDLVEFDNLLGKNTWDSDRTISNWWKDWALKNAEGDYLLNENGHPFIGSCYGNTVSTHNLMKNLISELKNNPDGRRHIINLWQNEDFNNPHGLKPCAFQTIWNVRHESSEESYLDMCLIQRSSDYLTAGIINQMQYIILQMMVAQSVDLKPGKFTWFVANMQIYDRHLATALKIAKRQSVECNPYIWLNPEIKNFQDFTIFDIQIKDYPRKEISGKNPQVQLELAI